VKELPSNTKHIILIDDVLTTGSTASEISKLLKGFGVRKVTIVTICLTLPKSKIS
jgi:predicted amidophosphoribosyltransferase